jgi:REP element-mobilizing transposase RayT
MPFWRMYYHLVWATKNRQPFITPEIERFLYKYTVKKAAEQGVYVYAIDGWLDHIHLIVSIPPKLAVSDVVKQLKGASSHEINLNRKLLENFEWQRGYGVLTLGERQRKEAIAYVCNQKVHHQDQTPMSWLERYSEFDEGPTDTGLKPEMILPAIGEARAEYDLFVEDKAPF